MTSETDAEFVERMANTIKGISLIDWDRLSNMALARRGAKAADRIEQLEAALREFCDRVERGEVKSVRTYAKFKSLLEERT